MTDTWNTWRVRFTATTDAITRILADSTDPMVERIVNSQLQAVVEHIADHDRTTAHLLAWATERLLRERM